MHKLIAKDFGLKLAEETRTNFIFYPNKMWRLFSVLLFFICSTFTFFFSFIQDFEVNIVLIILVFIYTILSIIMYLVSSKKISVNKKTNRILIKNIISKKEIQIQEIQKIIKLTTKEYVDINKSWRVETNIRYFIELNSNERIQLYWPLKSNTNALQNFDLIIHNLSKFFNLTIQEDYIDKTRK